MTEGFEFFDVRVKESALAGVQPGVIGETQWYAPADGDWPGSWVLQNYAWKDGAVDVTITIKLVHKTIVRVVEQNPRRILVCRGLVGIEILDRTERHKVVLLTLKYRLPWHGKKRFVEDILFDQKAIEVWLESEPVPASVLQPVSEPAPREMPVHV